MDTAKVSPLDQLNENINLLADMEKISISDSIYANRIKMISHATCFLGSKLDESENQEQENYAECIILLKELLKIKIGEFNNEGKNG